MQDLLTAFCNLFVSENKGLDVHLAATGHRYEEEHFGLQRNVRALGLRKSPLSAVERRAGARRALAADSNFRKEKKGLPCAPTTNRCSDPLPMN
ncbi:hypothetical protein [Variovorax sp. S12S4]|uniref:hypothetical protein n=1 Tax=Variovorax sp. S12S4 TaxID=3029170 RepID=UPI00215D4F73|nr:hypothetical protein [Variovorax sp. S12S4]